MNYTAARRMNLRNKKPPFLAFHEREYLTYKIVMSRRNQNFPFITIINIECAHIQNIKMYSYAQGTKTLIGIGGESRRLLEDLNTKWKGIW